ncbi:MAG TPA: ribosome-associated ATPase/putative transporter RbbA [Gemmatimonadaceae bacterium]|nr:ribosome-associated ATPase/putative transporter RbbA [Gemmatimonadaceae bacterium]
MSAQAAVARVRRLEHRYGSVVALDDVTAEIPAGCMAGLIGPDGVGKSTLLGLIAGAVEIQSGEVVVLGGDMGDRRHRRVACPRIAYMPQGLGKNLYADLSVTENLDFFARLFGQPPAARRQRIHELLESTGLADFPDRPVRQLSGGMRQKLGLCCALIHDPELLVLDEPTTGVDPLSRRQFWELIARIQARRPGMSVIVATAYMEEAERFDWLVALDGGRVLAAGTPGDLERQGETSSLEEAFIALLPERKRAGHRALTIPSRAPSGGAPVIVARDLTRKFRDFTAVDRVSFTIERGEIFGFVGSNGCGKTTTMRMLTGLLPPTSGEAFVFGQPVTAGGMQARERVGYMSQSFSLYTELTVRQNLALHAHLFHLPRVRAEKRVAELLDRFGLGPYASQGAADLPLGIRQRLSLAVAVVHEPEMLILDEPTSGVDPLARDAFWELLIDLARRQGVTIFVSTHFMNEAARCDRVALMSAGRVLAVDPPAELARGRGVSTLEEAFISYLEEAAPSADDRADASQVATSAPGKAASTAWVPFSPRRLFAYTARETLELLRDPIRLSFAVCGTAFLMLIFGAGISTDVTNLTFAVLDYDRSPESVAYLEELRGSTYFTERPPLANDADLEHRLRTGTIRAAIAIPPHFGRDLQRGTPMEIGAWIDGAMPFRAATIRGYMQAAHAQFLSDWSTRNGSPIADAPAVLEERFRYNQDFDSIYAMVPGTIAMLLALIPAILMALAVVREKELGSITNLYVTPVTRFEFLIGKQLPYIVLSLANFALLMMIAEMVFRVPFKGSFSTMLLAVVLYVTATTGYGMLISSFTQTQIAALFGATILTVLPATQFSGMMAPVSTLTGFPALMGKGFPMTYFLRVSVGTFTKSLGFQDLWVYVAGVAAFIPVFTILSIALLRKQRL